MCGGGRLYCMDLTTVAAFTAAGLALAGVVVNVVWSYRLSSREQLVSRE
jgi:hypothetical protein